MVNLKFLSKMQVRSDKQIPGHLKSDGNGDVINGRRKEQNNDSLLTKRRHSENVICGWKNDARKCNKEIKNVTMCIKQSHQVTQNTIDNTTQVSTLVTTTRPNDNVKIKYETSVGSTSKYTLKRTKDIKRDVCIKCKEIIKYIDILLKYNNDKITIDPTQKLIESIPNSGKFYMLNNNKNVLNEHKKTCMDAKQNEQSNIDCQSGLLAKSRCGITLKNNKSTSNESRVNNRNHYEKSFGQTVSSNRTSENDNSTVASNKPVYCKFNSDAMCYYVDLDNTCTSDVCPKKCETPNKSKQFSFKKKIDVGIHTDDCYKKTLFNKIGSILSCIATKLRSRQTDKNTECEKPFKDARNQTKKFTISIKKEPVCIIFENSIRPKNRCPNVFRKAPKKKVAFREDCVNLPKGLVAIKINPNNKRVINKRELKSILKSVPKKENKKTHLSPATSNVKVTPILKEKSSPISSACKGPMFVLKIDRNNMRILNYSEVKCKINNLNKTCNRSPSSESWVIAKGDCCDNKQKVRSVESKMSLWDRCRRSRSKSPCVPEKKCSQESIDKKSSKKSISDCKLISKPCKQRKKKCRLCKPTCTTKPMPPCKPSKTKAKKPKKVEKRKKKKPKKKKAKKPKKKVVKKRKKSKRKKSVRGVKKKKSSKKKIKKKKVKKRKRVRNKNKKSNSVFKKINLFFKNIFKRKKKKRTSLKLKKSKSKSTHGTCKNKPTCRQSKLERCQYAYLRHTKTPCLWLLLTCPFLHRNFMMFRSIFHDFIRCMLMLLALIFWCPCFLCIELFRCCFA